MAGGPQQQRRYCRKAAHDLQEVGTTPDGKCAQCRRETRRAWYLARRGPLHTYHEVPRLTEWRERRGLSKRQLAQKAGIHRLSVTYLERGDQRAWARTVIKLCAALQIRPPQLIEPDPEDESAAKSAGAKGYRGSEAENQPTPNPSARCHCGCGRITPVAKHTSTRDGTVMGEHRKYIAGHQLRNSQPLLHPTDRHGTQA